MPNFDIIKEVNPPKSFRCEYVRDTYDLSIEKIKEHFKGSIDFPQNWQIGLIVGNSGTGKTTIAKSLFPDAYIEHFAYDKECFLDDFPREAKMQDVCKTLNSVGFSSPPSWLKPYAVLSNGEKMRCDLARAILSEKELFVFDEFTSVVDRNVAKIGSLAMQKAIRQSDNKKQFIAVTCHFDVIEWLQPDWIFNTNDMTFSLSSKKKDQTSLYQYTKYQQHKTSGNIGKCLANIII